VVTLKSSDEGTSTEQYGQRTIHTMSICAWYCIVTIPINTWLHCSSKQPSTPLTSSSCASFPSRESACNTLCQNAIIKNTFLITGLWTKCVTLTFIIWPLNSDVAADGRIYFCFKCPCLHLRGTWLSLSSVKRVTFNGTWASCSANKG
jgi:hypothetical protein